MCCKCCSAVAATGAEIEEGDPDVVGAATILIDISRSPLESVESPSCTCGGLSHRRQIILEADNCPETEAEDWQAMGAEALRVRASGACLNPASQVELTTKSKEKPVVLREILSKTKIDSASEEMQQVKKKVKVKGATKQKDKGDIDENSGIPRSKKVRFEKLKEEE
jgi:hypothetical protein